MSDFILGAIVGVLLALIIAYWNQIKTLYQNKGAISDAANIVTSVQDLGTKI